MCGYIRRHIGPKSLREFLALLGVAGYIDESENGEPELEHFYPAFGGDCRRTIKGLIIKEQALIKSVEATWWYDCSEVEGELVVGRHKSFNARRLELPLWRDAIRYRRGFVVTSGFGESTEINSKKHHYLVTSRRPILLGAVYQSFRNGSYSCAIITRDPHPRFQQYHEDSFPLILPNNIEFLKLWLSEAHEDHPAIAKVLAAPKIYSNIDVTKVKTFVSGKTIGKTEVISADQG